MSRLREEQTTPMSLSGGQPRVKSLREVAGERPGGKVGAGADVAGRDPQDARSRHAGA